MTGTQTDTVLNEQHIDQPPLTKNENSDIQYQNTDIDTRNDPDNQHIRLTKAKTYTSENGSAAKIKRLRSTQVANLSKSFIKARQKRSKVTLNDLQESIEEMLYNLKVTNDIYKEGTDSHTDTCTETDSWMHKYSEAAKQIISDLESTKQRDDILSQTGTSVSPVAEISVHSGGSQRSQRVMFEASQADLEAKQAADRAIFKKRLTQMEAEKIKQQAELEAEQEVERARLKAKGLQAIAEAAVEAEQIPFRVPDDAISEPIIATKNVSYEPESHKWVDRWLSEDHTTHQIEDNQEPINAWIDRLIVGKETQMMESHTRSTDDVTHAILRLESERDLPHISLPTFNGSAIE